MSLDTQDCYSYLDILFPGQSNDPVVVEAERVAFMIRNEKERNSNKENYDAEMKRINDYNTANSCPKCSGKGYLSQFSHRKGGECYTCSGTGIFRRF